MSIFAATTNSYHGFSLSHAAAGIAEAGFEFCEIAAMQGWTQHVRPDCGRADFFDVVNLLDRQKLSCTAMSVVCNWFEDTEEVERLAIIAGKLRCKYLIAGVGNPGRSRDRMLPLTVVMRYIRALLPILEEYRLVLCLELSPEIPTGREMARVVRAVDHPLVKICYDTANAYCYGKVDPTEDVMHCMEEVAYIHLKDHSGADNVWNFPGLGNGELPLRGFMDRVKRADFNGVISVEAEFTREFAMRPKTALDLRNVTLELGDSVDYLRTLGISLLPEREKLALGRY